jgi:hypothetical protein
MFVLPNRKKPLLRKVAFEPVCELLSAPAHVASQLHIFQAVGPTPPLTTLDSPPNPTPTHTCDLIFNKQKTILVHENSS